MADTATMEGRPMIATVEDVHNSHGTEFKLRLGVVENLPAGLLDSLRSDAAHGQALFISSVRLFDNGDLVLEIVSASQFWVEIPHRTNSQHPDGKFLVIKRDDIRSEREFQGRMEAAQQKKLDAGS